MLVKGIAVGNTLEPIPHAAQGTGVPVLRGRPKPWRNGFPIIQAGYLTRLDTPGGFRPANWTLTTDLGAMHNLNPNYSVGGSMYIGLDDDIARFGAKVRLRRWLGKAVSIDLAPGIFATDKQWVVESVGPGYVGEASLSLGDWVVVTSQVEVIKRDVRNYGGFYPGGVYPSSTTRVTDTAWYFGAKVGGELGIPAFFLVLLGGMALSNQSIR
ncbi:MAG: hypothetical protein ACRENN_01065 [Candidatus Eiseniibacteriota bacterium]